MATRYVGNCGFEESADAEMDIDPFGMDQLVRTFVGRRDQWPEFRRTLRKDGRDAEYPQLTLESIRARFDRSWVTATVQYAGLENDELPEAVKEGGWNIATVQLESEAGTQTEIDYGAPTTVYRYVTRERPKVQQYKGKMLATEAQFQIMARRGNKRGQLLRYNRTIIGDTITLPLDVGPLDFGYYTVIVTESFTFAKVGQFWQVTETNVGRITDTNERQLGLGGIPSASVLAV